jgi:hypothetical protein
MSGSTPPISRAEVIVSEHVIAHLPTVTPARYSLAEQMPTNGADSTLPDRRLCTPTTTSISLPKIMAGS